MKALQSRCSKCNAVMVFANHGDHSTLTCPYCGNAKLLVESDTVKVAQIHAATELTGMEYRYREHRDHLDFARSRRRGQNLIIGICGFIALILICVYVCEIA